MPGKTEYVFLKGKTSWFFPFKLNKFGKWAHQLHPDEASLEIIRDLQSQGVKNQLKKDEDGYYINISRPPEIEVWTDVGRKKVALEPPKVVDKDGNPFQGSVGNGSDITTKLEVYSHRTPAAPGSTTPGKAKAMRWMSSRIDNLIPFESKRDFTEGEQKQVDGLADQPKQEEFF